MSGISRDTWVRPFLRRYRKALLLALGLGLAAVVFSIGLMFVSGYLLSGTAEKPDSIFQLVVPLAFVQVFGIVRPFLSYLERLAAHDWVLRATSELRARLFSSLAADGAASRLVKTTGEALGLMADDIAHMQDLFVRCAFPVVVGLAGWLVAMAALGFFSIRFALFMLLLIALVAVVSPLVTMLVNSARSMRAKHLRARLYSDATDDVLGLADWVCSGRRDEFLDRIDSSAAAVHVHDERARSFGRWRDLIVQVVLGASVLAVTVWAAGTFGVAGIGAQAAGGIQESGLWAPGARNLIAAFAIAVFPLFDALLPMADAAGGAPAHLDAVDRLNGLPEPNGAQPWSEAKVSQGVGLGALMGIEGTAITPTRPVRDSDTADEPEPVVHPQADETVPQEPLGSLELRFSGVSFAYGDAGAAPAIDGLDLVIEAGEKIAVLGPSGSGKSTLLALARGDLAPLQGTVTVGGLPAASLGARRSKLIGFVEQNPYVFDATLLDNVRLGRPDASQEQAMEALERVGLEQLASGMPQGVHSRVGEGGARLSGGQRHRLALARILLADQPVVLLDEPMASLDPATETAVLATLFEVLEGRTVVMVTHHLLGVERFDRVVFFERGNVARDGDVPLDGSSAELAQKSERYRRLLAFDRGL